MYEKKHHCLCAEDLDSERRLGVGFRISIANLPKQHCNDTFCLRRHFPSTITLQLEFNRKKLVEQPRSTILKPLDIQQHFHHAARYQQFEGEL